LHKNFLSGYYFTLAAEDEKQRFLLFGLFLRVFCEFSDVFYKNQGEKNGFQAKNPPFGLSLSQ